MNPYESPTTTSVRRQRKRPIDWRWWTVDALLSVFATGAALQYSQLFGYDGMREFLMPRFGWTGAGDGMWPGIFLGLWLLYRHWGQLFAASFMCFFTAGQQATALLSKGTTGTVTNAFHDRLHESWLWAVVPMVIAGLVCFALGVSSFRSRRERVRIRRAGKRWTYYPAKKRRV